MASSGRRPSYAELHCLSNFSFLRGASHPEELVETAIELGYAGLALTDECSVAGVVRAHAAACQQQLQFVVGSEISVTDELKIVVLAPTRAAYAALCDLISHARTAVTKGQYRVEREDLTRYLCGSECLLLWPPGRAADIRVGEWLKDRFDDRVWLAVEHLVDGRQQRIFDDARHMSRKLGLRMVASGNVHMHSRKRRKLQDTLTAIRRKQSLDRLGFDLYPNAERYLRSLAKLEKIYPLALLNETIAILERVRFSLDELRYEYPRELVPDGHSPASHLRALTEQGMRWRWPEGMPEKVVGLVEHELALIADLRYEPYFLTVYDIVQFARGRGILCQGRGSAANSAVCYCLGITEVDPASMETLVERFISKERNEPPDIDVDFEHERREEVIQYIYSKYSRKRAALAATVITYRPKSAIRDVGKALGLEDRQVDELARSLQWWDGHLAVDERISEAGFDWNDPKVSQLLYLVNELLGFPRHLSQHVGGFVISAGPLSQLVPIENAAMPERTVIQWDKNDLETLGLLKVDILALGMLSAIRRSFASLASLYGRPFSMSDVPQDDPDVYDMICRADTVGVFQIESRAQMAMLPRLKPRCYYDLVIEVAIIRPGPIQGDMVHPYLRRRNKEEEVTYPSHAVRKVLERTLGVPIFQEQVMQLAIVAAGFTPGEADQLRRAMAAWRRRGDLEHFRERLIRGMLERGYAERFAEQIFNQIKGFGEYGFPESHAASFALLAYVSAWLKHHEPAVFFCALLNSQPMGFYAPAQLIRCARDHAVEIGAVDITTSIWDSALTINAREAPGIRLGLRLVKGLSEAGAERLVSARRERVYSSVQDMARRARLDARDLGALAAAGALRSFAHNRYQARWSVAGIEAPTPLLENLEVNEALPLLNSLSDGENVCADYRHLGFSLGAHPLALLRERLHAMRIRSAREVNELAHDERVYTAGLVITRQRPSSASGVTFVTIEDETGYLNLIVWKSVAERERKALLGATLLGAEGYVQKEGQVLHVIVQRLHDHGNLLGQLDVRSRDFR
jgi:error-prone DNA polymerase